MQVPPADLDGRDARRDFHELGHPAASTSPILKTPPTATEHWSRRIPRASFPDDRSLIRLASSLCIEQNYEWLVGRRYLSAGPRVSATRPSSPSIPIQRAPSSPS